MMTTEDILVKIQELGQLITSLVTERDLLKTQILQQQQEIALLQEAQTRSRASVMTLWDKFLAKRTS